VVKIQLYPQGSRVRVRRGSFPIDPNVLGRPGTVVHLLKGGGDRYGVQFDGEDRIRVFAEDELEPLASAARSPAESGEPQQGGSGTASSS
jgi:hypothetical protein